MMKKQVALTLLVSLMGLGIAHGSEIETKELHGPVYDCQLSGKIKGYSIAIGVGGQRLEGPGELTCRHNLTGEVTRMNVNILMSGIGIGLDFTQVRSVRILSAGVGVNDPRYFFQNYAVGATAGLNLIRLGIGADAAIRVSGRNGAGFEVGLLGKDILGLGAHLYGMVFKVMPAQRPH